MEHWKYEPFTYQICLPPAALRKSFHEMTPEEVQAHLSWYMDVLPQRIDYLSDTIAEELPCERSALDLSPESLRLVWRWFLKVGKTEEAEKLLHHRKVVKPTLQTEYILQDIGKYLGETFVRNHGCLHWGFFLNSGDHYENQVLVLGFKDQSVSPPFQMRFEPMHMARGLAFLALGAYGHPAEPDEDALIKWYQRWEQFCFD